MYSIRYAVVALATISLCTVAARADDQPEVNALLDRAIEAAGGKEYLTKNQAVVISMKGTASVPGTDLKGVQFSGTVSIEPPEKNRQAFRFGLGGTQASQTLVYDGKADQGWATSNGMTIEMNEAYRKEARQDLHAGWKGGWAFGQLARLKDGQTYQLTPLAEIEVDGRPAVGMKVSRQGYREVKLYFDKQTYLLVKQAYPSTDFLGGGGMVQSEAFYSGHAKVDGVMAPKKMVVKRGGEPYLTAKLTELVASESLPEGTFEKP